jgi:hypothetical protein
MNRRDPIAVLASAVAARPPAARATSIGTLDVIALLTYVVLMLSTGGRSAERNSSTSMSGNLNPATAHADKGVE